MNAIASNVQLELGARGWRHAHWCATFYPDTLPPDWQLSYYSNEFRHVLVPAEELALADAPTVCGWCDDVNDEFQFWLEVQLASTRVSPSPAHVLACSADLGSKLRGVLLRVAPQVLSNLAPLYGYLAATEARLQVHVDLPADVGDGVVQHVAAAGHSLCWRNRGTESARDCRIGMVPAESTRDLRALRVDVQAFLEQAGAGKEVHLLFEGAPPNIDGMRNAQVIASLLGI